MGRQLQQAGRIQALINTDNFINPIEKIVENELEDIIKHIAAQFGPEQDESNEEDIKQPKIKVSETIAALQQLQLYEEQQDEGDTGLLHLLTKYEQRIKDRRIRERQQIPITAFFNANRSEA